MNDDRAMNHKLHIFLAVITAGLYVPIYLMSFLVFKLTKSTISTRRDDRKNFKTSQKPSLGYKKGGKYGNSFSLECNHSIVASAMMYSGLGLIGKKVYCEVCKEERRVTASI